MNSDFGDIMGFEPEKSEIKSSENIKKLKDQFLNSGLFSRVLNDNLPPGGGRLTLHLGETLKLNKDSKVLIFKCGRGASVLTLKRGFDCKIVGVDPEVENIEAARQIIEKVGMSENIVFKETGLHQLDFSDRTFDAVISESAISSYSINDRASIVSDMYRVLNSGGRIGITDVTLEGDLPEELVNILSHVISISDALSASGYQDLLESANFKEIEFEDHSYALIKLLEKGKKLLPGIRLVRGLFNVDLESILGFPLEDIPHLLELGISEIQAGNIKYGMLTAVKR